MLGCMDVYRSRLGWRCSSRQFQGLGWLIGGALFGTGMVGRIGVVTEGVSVLFDRA